MGIFKSREQRELEQKQLIKRTVYNMNKQIEALEEQKKSFAEKATRAKANGLDAQGKVYYGRGSGVCLETQFYPDSCNHPQWPQPLVHAGQAAQSVTEFRFSVEPEG